MDNNLRKQYDILEFVKEIAPEMDLSKINMSELAVKKEQIREAILEVQDRELSNEEREAADFLELLLDVEPGEEVLIEPIEVSTYVGNPVDEISEVVSEDLDLIVAPVDPLTSALIYEIQGGGNYQARLVESARAWEETKSNSGKRERGCKEYSR